MRATMQATAAMAALAALLMLPALVRGPFLVESQAYNLVWTTQFGEALARGELYPRWLPASFEGLGAPTFYFYPPLAFHLSGAFAAAGLSAPAAVAAAGLALTFAAGLAMHAWLRLQGGRALLGAMLYMAAPYHLVDFHQRAALAEFAALAWLPLIALGVEGRRGWAPPLLAVSFAGLIMTHLPMAVLASVGLIAPLAARRILAERSGWTALRLGSAGAVGAALPAVYLLPALSLQAHVSPQLLWTPFYQPERWSPFGGGDGVPTAALDWPAVLAAAAVVLAVGCAWRSAAAGDRRPVFWAGLTVATAALALALAPGFWSLPVLEKVQFPWRMLAVVEFAAVTAFALSPKAPARVLGAAAVLAALAYARILLVLGQASTAPATPPEIARTMPDAVEYLPAGFDTRGLDELARGFDLSPYRGPEVRGPVVDIRRGADGSLAFQATARGEVVARRFWFPGWRVERDGQAVASGPVGPGRLVGFNVEPGRYRVFREEVAQARLGGWISLGGLLGLAALAAWPGRIPPGAPGGLGAGRRRQRSRVIVPSGVVTVEVVSRTGFSPRAL